MLIKKEHVPVFLVAVFAVIFFAAIFISRKNYEFIVYVFVIILLMALILVSNRKINYPNVVLWSLTIWAILHMAGGGLYIKGKKLYELIIFRVVGEPYNIFKFDQFVHIFGFFAATVAIFYVLKPLLNEKVRRPAALSIVVVMAGLGLGALNEIIEFSATVLVPETGVGGYENTSLDLVSDLVGAMIAMAYLIKKEKIYFG